MPLGTVHSSMARAKELIRTRVDDRPTAIDETQQPGDPGGRTTPPHGSSGQPISKDLPRGNRRAASSPWSATRLWHLHLLRFRGEVLAGVDEAVFLEPVLGVVELPISAPGRQQFGVGATLDNLSVL